MQPLYQKHTHITIYMYPKYWHYFYLHICIFIFQILALLLSVFWYLFQILNYFCLYYLPLSTFICKLSLPIIQGLAGGKYLMAIHYPEWLLFYISDQYYYCHIFFCFIVTISYVIPNNKIPHKIDIFQNIWKIDHSEEKLRRKFQKHCVGEIWDQNIRLTICDIINGIFLWTQ